MAWLSCILSNVVLASLVALAAWFVQRRLKRPEIARTIWVLVLVKLVTPPLVSVPLLELPATMTCSLGICHCGQHAATGTIAGYALPWILLVVWTGGAGAWGWTAWRRWTRFRRLMAHASPAPPEWQSMAARFAFEPSLGGAPQILSVPGRLPPLVVPGWRRPRLLLPTDVLGQLDAAQRDSLLMHELVHLKRGDHLVRMVELTVGAAYWWLPIVGWIGRHLRACEETCCDAAVVAHLPQARREYARLLLDVLDFADPLPGQALPQATAMSAANDLDQRLRAILYAAPRIRHRWPARVFAAGLACAVLPCELHCDFIGRGATSAALEPTAESRGLPGGDRPEEQFTEYCCPS